MNIIIIIIIILQRCLSFAFNRRFGENILPVSSFHTMDKCKAINLSNQLFCVGQFSRDSHCGDGDDTLDGTVSNDCGTRDADDLGDLNDRTDGDGDGDESVRERRSAKHQAEYHDEPEVDFDVNPTDLYKLIENKDWDGATRRLDEDPFEAQTWVSRREAHGVRKVRWRLLPVHATCVFRSPLSLIEKLIRSFPDGPQMKDDQGMLPIHLACRNGASKGVVITLLNAFPESISVKDRKGRVPLTLVENSTSQNREAVIISMKRFRSEMHNKTSTKSDASRSSAGAMDKSENLAKATPSVLCEAEVDYDHRTDLFRFILKKDWEAAVRRSSSHPDEAGTWIVTKGFNGNLRFLPVHKACVFRPPTSVIAALVSSHPEGAKSRDQDGWLPLHCACFYGASEGVVESLLAANPRAAQVKDDDGRLPLHYSCLKGAPDDVVSALLKSFPKSALSKDDVGRLPIHYACSKGSAAEVVESLLRASPKGAQSKDDQGRLSLHHACRKNAPERVVKTLLRVYPRGAQIKDDQDKLPVHYACQSGAAEGTVNALLSTYPESVEVKNGFGYTPLAEARAMDNPKMGGIISLLENFKDQQDRIRETAENSGPGGGGKAMGGGGLNDPPMATAVSGVDNKKMAKLGRQVKDLTSRVLTLEGIFSDIGRVG